MTIDATTPAWLKPLKAALQPGSPIMVAFETAERVMREQRERDIRAHLDLQQWMWL
jgi:hypothetical protein